MEKTQKLTLNQEPLRNLTSSAVRRDLNIGTGHLDICPIPPPTITTTVTGPVNG